MQTSWAVFQFLIVILSINSGQCNIDIQFYPLEVTVHMGETETLQYSVLDLDEGSSCVLFVEDEHVAILVDNNIHLNETGQDGTFEVKGNFLGLTTISCRYPNNSRSDAQIEVRCLRKQRVIDQIFTASTAFLVAVIYVNFGCAVDWSELRTLSKRPIGPILGFCGQFIFMPLLSYGFGFVLFPDSPAMRLGMFFTGTAPGGGASNIWTAILEGNIDLSILMSTISTVAAFGMIPFWMFTLGATIFDDADIEVPYGQISTYVIALVIPLGIGYLIQRYLKKFANFMKRILKVFSTCLILFIIIFAIVTNLYLFELFSWQIIFAGMVIPWIGYCAGYIAALICRQPHKDAIAIAVEIGIQNTGISIFLLRFSLDPLNADLTTVIPVSVAIMTPLPLICLFIILRLKKRFCYKPKALLDVTNDEQVGSTDGNTEKDAGTFEEGGVDNPEKIKDETA